MRIDCPGCGGHLAITPSDQFVTCEYCDNSLHVELGSDLTKTTFKRNISPRQIPGLLSRELRQRDLRDRAKVLNMNVILFPFWRFESANRTWIRPATSTMDRVLREYSMEAGALDFFSPPEDEKVVVEEPDIYLDTALTAVEDDLDRETLRPSLLYVPFYRIRYLYGQHEYLGYVSGHTGQVLFETVPPGLTTAGNIPLALTSFLVFILYFLVSFSTVYFTGRFSFALVACLALSFPLFRFISSRISQ